MRSRWILLFAATLPALVAAGPPPAMGPARAVDIEGIAGVVGDWLTQAPLAGVLVVANGVDLADRMATTTDARGLFHFPTLRPGSFVVWSRPAGYLRTVQSARVEPGGATLVALDAIQPQGVRDVPHPPAEAEQKAGPLRFEARTLRSTYLAGEPIRILGLLRNVGSEPIVVVKQVEGSTSYLRNPTYGLRAVMLPDGTPAAVSPMFGGMCGVTNPLFNGDVVELLPGESVDPFEPLDGHHFRQGHVRADGVFSLERPGRYAVILEYTNVATRIEKVAECPYPRDRPGPSESARLRGLHLPLPKRAPLVVDRLQSNRVEFEVVEQPEAAGVAVVPPPTQPPFEPGRVVVEVRDGDGRPISKASVSGLGLGLFASGGDGRFTRANVLPGRYELVARDSAAREIGRQTVDIAPGAEVALRFQSMRAAPSPRR